MITQIGGPDAVSVTKDPRRKSQSIQFDKRARIPYNAKMLMSEADAYSPNHLNAAYKRKRQNALWTSFSITLGSVLFLGTYLGINALKKGRV